jgi:putative endonuclease
MKTKKMAVGERGEAVALQYLQSKGYLLYARNVQVGYREIDLILFDTSTKCIVFVEVKARSRIHDYYSPVSAMHYRKKQNLYKAMQQWIVEHDYEGLARTDVVYVIGDRVTGHHEGIFAEN